MSKKEKKVEDSTLPFKPEVGWVVSNVNANVFMDVVISIESNGFICKQTGLWTGTTNGWIAHNTLKKDVNE